jgi:hypothetical protein
MERAKREAWRLVGELSAERVWARIVRERDACFEAACYQVGQLLWLALEESGA